MTTAHRGWTPARVAALSPGEAAKLRSDLASQAMAQDASERRDAFALLRLLEGRTDGARSLEERTQDARDFLYPGAASASTRQCAWLAAVHLCGSEKEAERRGHKRPA